MKTIWRFLLPLPLAIMLLQSEARAQATNVGIGLGIGYGPRLGNNTWGGFGSAWNGPFVGPAWGPRVGPGFGNWGPWGRSWGPWGPWGPNNFYFPFWGFIPSTVGDCWSNGYSLYGPPVPTYKPIGGVFGGGDYRLFYHDSLAPYFRHHDHVDTWDWVTYNRPGTIPPGIGPEPKVFYHSPPIGRPLPTEAALNQAIELELLLPRADARVFIDGQETKSTGQKRIYSGLMPSGPGPHVYEVKVVYEDNGEKVWHTKRVPVVPGQRSTVEIKN